MSDLLPDIGQMVRNELRSSNTAADVATLRRMVAHEPPAGMPAGDPPDDDDDERLREALGLSAEEYARAKGLALQDLGAAPREPPVQRHAERRKCNKDCERLGLACCGPNSCRADMVSRPAALACARAIRDDTTQHRDDDVRPRDLVRSLKSLARQIRIADAHELVRGSHRVARTG